MISSIQAACTVVDPPRRSDTEVPSVLSFYRDLVEPFGCTVDKQLLQSGANVSHRDLADELASHETMRDRAPGLIIVTYALPDVHPFTAVASHINMLFGGEAKSFSISGQGLAAPFSALRVVDTFQQSGRVSEALVAILEQTTLPTRFPLVHDNQLVNSGVFLALDTRNGFKVDAIESFDNNSATIYRLSELTAENFQETLLVLGPWVTFDAANLSEHLHRVAARSYCTSVWSQVASNWQTWQRQYRTVVLCDTEPRTGCSYLVVLGSPNEELKG